ncbi:MAG: helical backbone metal receptor [Actinobacteria bacterium]|nr:helical backbone metal receptor [Actinomycetota bacterium]
MSVTDATGVEVPTERAPTRIVSLVPSISELLHRLGVGDRVVGVTTFCLGPPGGFASAERVRGTKNPDVDAILRLGPDLVFANLEENREHHVAALRDAGATVHVSYPQDVDAARTVIQDVARLVYRRPEAAVLLADLDGARAAASRRRPDPTVAVLCAIWRDPWMVVGPGTYAGALLAECGLQVSPLVEEPYPQVRLDEHLGAVDAVLLPDEPYAFTARDAAGIVAQGVPARLVDGAALTWHGSRTATGLRTYSALAEELARQRP